MATPLLLRALPFLRRRLVQHHLHLRLANASTASRPFCSTAVVTESTGSDGDKSLSLSQVFSSKTVQDPTHYPRWGDPDFRKWKDRESEILEDIEPIICLTKEILHSNRYMDGERLTPDDEKAVVDKLLAHHPHSEDKIGCGLDSIMVFPCEDQDSKLLEKIAMNDYKWPSEMLESEVEELDDLKIEENEVIDVDEEYESEMKLVEKGMLLMY
ncbi:protein dcl chloroplastic [Phtheirospermum japonicum]|uniref:Protein dcl chloroplastic n=1 Tax=Phtheirospermum japonicum TaxID=374723 RepID=A0A830BBS7_9LAMI|nr:protein dcl chloroplastic [Phtheirospermum japonicum]